jgi:hypothetical protein
MQSPYRRRSGYILDSGSETGDTIFEVVFDNLHYRTLVLDDGEIWRPMHFRGSIQEAVRRHSRIRVDDQDDLSDTNIA